MRVTLFSFAFNPLPLPAQRAKGYKPLLCFSGKGEIGC